MTLLWVGRPEHDPFRLTDSVMCGWPPASKGFFTRVERRNLAVMCPAC